MIQRRLAWLLHKDDMRGKSYLRNLKGKAQYLSMSLVLGWGGGWGTSCWMWIMERERGMRGYRNHSMMHGSMQHLEILGAFHLEGDWIAASNSWRDVKRNQRSNCQHPLEIMENAREFQKKIYFCFITPKPLTVWVTTNYGKFWKRWEYQTTWLASWVKSSGPSLEALLLIKLVDVMKFQQNCSNS